MRTCYMHHLHTTLDDIRIGEKVFMAYRPDYDATMRVTNGVVASVNATSVRTTREGNDCPPLDPFTEDQFGSLTFEQPEPSLNVDMLGQRCRKT